MKFFTREWFKLCEASEIDLSMCVTKSAETFSEEYFQNLYCCKLKQHLRLQKEMSELTADDIFNPRQWDSLTVVDDSGDFTDASLILSPDKIERIRLELQQKEQDAYDKYVPQIYDEEALTIQFDNNMHSRKQQLESLLPEEILKDVADIRVLALDIVSADMKARIRKFCAQNEEKLFRIYDEFQIHSRAIKSQLPEKIRNNYGFHDCIVSRINQQGSDVIIELDHSGGFTDVNKIIYHDATILERDHIEGSCWVDDEIYIVNDSYEFHSVLQDGYSNVLYFTVRASDIDFILEFQA